MHDLETLERAGWDALGAGTGGQFYGSLMTPDAVMVLAHGAVLDRDQVVASPMTSCYVRHEGDWRLAVYQQTVIP